MPFSAVRGFYDPSVNFELEFDTLIIEDEDGADIAELDASKEIAKLETPQVNEASEDADKDEASEEKDGGADVVSLDAFRKKP